MSSKNLQTRQLTYARLRAQGTPVVNAYSAAGYKGAATNAYRLENRPDVQDAIAAFQRRRAEALSLDEENPVKAEALSDPAFAQQFLLDSLLAALAQAKVNADAKTTVTVVGKIVDLLALKFDPSDLKEDADHTSDDLARQIEALKR